MVDNTGSKALSAVEARAAWERGETKNRPIRIQTYNIHDILDGDQECPVTIETLQRLIAGQADLHRTSALFDAKSLKNVLRNRGSTVRGFVLYAEETGPVAYSIYYPMIDSDGQRVAYCEDFFIVESYRGHGIAPILFQELAKRTLEDKCEYLQWATDGRNQQVHGFVQNKLGAKHPPIRTIDAISLLGVDKFENLLRQEWSAANYSSRVLKPSDTNFIEKLGYNNNFIRTIGELDFRGIITFEKNSPDKPVAVTPGWVHFSTFRHKEGIHLENPRFDSTIDSEEAKKGILISTVKAASKYANSKYPYLRWHIDENDPVMPKFLMEDLKLLPDSMVGTSDSELIVYTLTNGNLHKLAESKPSREIVINTNTHIGERPVPPKNG